MSKPKDRDYNQLFRTILEEENLFRTILEEENLDTELEEKEVEEDLKRYVEYKGDIENDKDIVDFLKSFIFAEGTDLIYNENIVNIEKKEEEDEEEEEDSNITVPYVEWIRGESGWERT